MDQKEETFYEPYDSETQAFFERRLVDEKIRIQTMLQRNSEPVFVEELRGTENKSEFVARHKMEENNNKGTLADIEAALLRIKEGNYGSCIDCGKQILLTRLMGITTAKR